MKCKKCNYEWNPKCWNPKECPQCKNRDYKLNNFCFICEKELSPDGHMHHIDGNKKNNKTTNLLPVCKKCHMTIHYPNRTKKSKYNKRALFLLKYYTNLYTQLKK